MLDSDCLAAWGLGAPDIEALAAGIPMAVLVTPGNAPALWAERRSSSSSRPEATAGRRPIEATSSLDRSGRILKVDYVAQSFVPLGARMVKIAGGTEPLKADVRLYTYAGAVQLTAARLYQGQATKFRTPRGGVAPVVEVG